MVTAISFYATFPQTTQFTVVKLWTACMNLKSSFTKLKLKGFKLKNAPESSLHFVTKDLLPYEYILRFES